MKPCNNHVVVRKIEPNSTTEGGIVLPEKAFQDTQEAEVISRGDNCDKLNPGDKIVYAAYAGQVYKDLLILKSEDILGIL